MEIKKVAGVSEEEFATVAAAGKIVKELAEGLVNKDIDVIDDKTTKLLSALADIIGKALNK